jgi:hypothetical protein
VQVNRLNWHAQLTPQVTPNCPCYSAFAAQLTELCAHKQELAVLRTPPTSASHIVISCCHHVVALAHVWHLLRSTAPCQVRLGLSTMGHRAGGNVARNYVHFTEACPCA